jgi:hypothetical protein
VLHTKPAGAPPEQQRDLIGRATEDRSRADRSRRLKPGTVLLSEYQGERHTVTVFAGIDPKTAKHLDGLARGDKRGVDRLTRSLADFATGLRRGGAKIPEIRKHRPETGPQNRPETASTRPPKGAETLSGSASL